MLNRSSLLKITFVAAALAGFAGSAAAATAWQFEHPRRAEINGRLANQDCRIREEVRDGEMSRAEAARLHFEDRQVRREERLMVAENGGYLTRGEQRALNGQLNFVSAQISR